MNVVLTNSVLLPLAALVLVPLIVHLFARARPPVYRFSAVEWLRRVRQKTMRLRRPQSFLVWLLRTLLFTALVGVFFKPVWFDAYRPGGLGAQRNVVLLVDATASMGVVEATRTRLAAACAKGTEILAGLGAADRANIVWLGTPNRREFPQLAVNTAYLKKALRNGTVTSEASDPSAALALAAEMLQGRPGKREIYILSDFQSSAWGTNAIVVPAGVDIYPIKIGSVDPGNQALTAIHLAPANPLPGEDVTVTCDVWNYSAAHSLNTLFLRVGETPQTREFRIDPWQQTAVSFQVRLDTPGERVVTASLNEDAFPADNERWALLEVAPQIRVGLFAGDPAMAACWQRAFEALEWVKIEPVNEQQLEQELKVDALFLSGWKGTNISRVSEYLAQGGLVVWSPSPSTTSDQVALMTQSASPSVTTRPPKTIATTAPCVWEQLAKPLHLRIVDREFPAWKLFADGMYGDPVRGLFKSRLRLSPETASNGKTIVDYEDGVPALILHQNIGRLFIWNLPLRRERSDWAAQPGFLPFFGEMLTHCRLQPLANRTRACVAGQRLSRDFDVELLPEDVRVEYKGTVLKTDLRAVNHQTVVTTEEARVPGVYSWLYRGNLLQRQVVNFPAIESDLRTQAKLQLGSAKVGVLSSGNSLEQMHAGTPCWPWLLGLGLLFLVLEGLVLSRLDRS